MACWRFCSPCSFRWFPYGEVDWDDAWRGGLVTAVLFNIGKLAIAWYIGSQGLESTHGAHFRVLLIWVYYSAQIVLFGGEITHVYAHQKNAKPPLAWWLPVPHNVRLAGLAREFALAVIVPRVGLGSRAEAVLRCG
jgi:uncharacterized BrkB/YihY/UPF0761 family membrane protein